MMTWFEFEKSAELDTLSGTMPLRSALASWRAFRSQTHVYQGKRIAYRAFQVVNVACACHLFLEYVGGISFMSGMSMLPTLAGDSGELVIEAILPFTLFGTSSIERGDMITLYSPLHHNRVVCKRVLGLPGDVICVDPTGDRAPSTEHVLVPPGHLWVNGDNAKWSIDSRDYGPVPMRLVRGRLWARILPWDKRAIFRNPTTTIS